MDLNKYNVGFLTLGATHDDYSEIEKALHQQNITASLINLNDCEEINWSQFDLINVRECRGFHLDHEVLAKFDAINEQLGNTPLLNSMQVIRAGLDKGVYLKALGDEGVNLIPTRWFQQGEAVDLPTVLTESGWQDFVIKPTVASKCWNTYRVVINHTHDVQIFEGDRLLTGNMDDSIAIFHQLLEKFDLCMQAFMPEIFSSGEFSFVFIDGLYSHAVNKQVAHNSWLAHEAFGGKNSLYQAKLSEIDWAQQIFAKLTQRYGDFLYARIDAVPHQGQLLLLECELVVPRLFLKEADALAKYAEAIKKRIV